MEHSGNTGTGIDYYHSSLCAGTDGVLGKTAPEEKWRFSGDPGASYVVRIDPEYHAAVYLVDGAGGCQLDSILCVAGGSARPGEPLELRFTLDSLWATVMVVVDGGTEFPNYGPYTLQVIKLAPDQP